MRNTCIDYKGMILRENASADLQGTQRGRALRAHRLRKPLVPWMLAQHAG
jgi:hypothetical protein